MSEHTNFCHWKAKSERQDALLRELMEALEVEHRQVGHQQGWADQCDICNLLRRAQAAVKETK